MFRKIVFLLVILVGVGIGIWQLLSSPCTETTSVISSVRTMSLFGYNNQGKSIWAIQAETGKMQDGKDSKLFNVSIRLLSDDARDVLGGCDVLSYIDGQAKMKGDVTFTEQDGISLVTDEAFWDTKKSEITASDVTIKVQSSSLVAPIFRYQTDERRAGMSGGIQALLDGSSPIVVTSDQADANKDSICMDGNVRVQVRQEAYTAKSLDYRFSSDETTLSGAVTGAFSGGRIKADELMIHGNQIEAQGGVEINLTQEFFGKTNGA